MSPPAAKPSSQRILPVVMAGGAGTRLWPLSTPSRPKQFVALAGPRSSFEETLERVTDSSLVSAAGRHHRSGLRPCRSGSGSQCRYLRHVHSRAFWPQYCRCHCHCRMLRRNNLASNRRAGTRRRSSHQRYPRFRPVDSPRIGCGRRRQYRSVWNIPNRTLNRLRLHSPRPRFVTRRGLRRKARCGSRHPLCRRWLSLELRKLPVPRRSHGCRVAAPCSRRVGRGQGGPRQGRSHPRWPAA